ncbi:MAG: hypothetical protein RI953_1815 [Pseudomonadota bacterium]
MIRSGTTFRLFVYLIAFGGNTGNREQNAHGSLAHLQSFGRLGRQSTWTYTQPLRSSQYQTDDHGEYLNFVFEFASELEPHDLYAKICMIEDQFGHDRVQRWRPRAVDFDLLFYARSNSSASEFRVQDSIIYQAEDSSLRIPHPEVWQRDFLLNMIEADLKISLVELRDFFCTNKVEREN